VAERLQIHLDAIDNTRKAFSSFQNRLDKIKSSVFNLRSALLGIGAGAVLKGFLDAGVEIENLGVQLKALFGSATQGQKALQQVVKYASTTPFELRNIQQGITSLAVVRKQAEEAGISFEELLKITGNTATLLGNDFALASLQVQRSLSAGIASAELFRERGVTAMSGFSGGVRVTARDSAIALRKTFGTGGEFGNLTDDLSKTLFGTVSNIKDTFFIFQASVAEGFFGKLKEQLGDLQSFLQTNEQQIKDFGVGVGNTISNALVKLGEAVIYVRDNLSTLKDILIAIIGIKVASFFLQLILLVKDLAKAIGVLTLAILANPIFTTATLVATGIGLIAKAIYDAKDATDAWKNSLEEIDLEDFLNDGKKIKEVFPSIDKLILPQPKPIGLGIPDDVEGGAINVKKIIDANSALKQFGNSLKYEIGEATKKLKEDWDNIYNTVAQGIVGGVKSISQGIAESIVLGKKLSDTFRQLAQQVLVTVIQKIIEKIILLGIEKLLSETIFKKEKDKLNEMKKQESSLKRQIALQAILMALGGGNGGFSLFQEGGRVNGTRANGGGTQNGNAYIVGERGRELFIPSTDGQIVSNENLKSMGGANITFNINATDVKGVKELLIDNRATITNIINSALNQKGKPALV